MGIEGFLGGINWSIPSWDLFIGLFFIIAVVLYGLALGRDRILVILLSIYIALAITSNLPFITERTAEKFGFGTVFVLKIVVFSAAVVFLFFLFSKIGFFSSFTQTASIFHVGMFSVLHVGLLISIILSFLPETAIETLASFTRTLFISDLAKFLWILAPIVAMFLVKKSSGETEIKS